MRMSRVLRVTHAGQAEGPIIDPTSATGYAEGKRWLIVPEHHNPTYQWIQETQQMFARGEWRIRHINYENAPEGREVHASSPYHWYIAALSWCHHALSGKPLGWCVEQSALWADPLLHLLLLLTIVPLVARAMGAKAAIFAALGTVTLYPFSASFLPGVLSDQNLACITSIWCVLFAVIGLGEARDTNRWWLLSGIAGGCGLWINAGTTLPVLSGFLLGGIAAAIVQALDQTNRLPPIPWRLWGLGAAVASLLGYLIEYYPNDMALRLEVNHPLYALSCVGFAELLSCVETWARHRKFPARARDIVSVVFGLIAAAALPIVMIWKQSFPPVDLFARQLTNEPDGIVAHNFATWLGQAGASKLSLLCTLLPVLLLVPAVWLLARPARERYILPSVALALGVICVIVTLSFWQLRWWTLSSGVLLILGLVLSNANNLRSLVLGIAGIAFISGAFQVVHAYAALRRDAFTSREVEELYERRLAHWLSDRTGPERALVLAPPFRTPSLNFYGGLRGLGTQNWENREGLGTTFRIANATLSSEAQAILNERGVTYIILPSWDHDLGEVARLALPDEKRSFIYQLEHLTVFNWLRPLPFHLPEIDGQAEPAALVLQVVEESNRAVAISRFTEYFLEMDRVEIAEQAAHALREFPSDLGANIALAELEKAKRDEVAFRRSIDSLAGNLSAGADRFLPWQRRINLAAVLAIGGRNDLAQTQAERAWKEMNETRLRSLTTGELYRLMILGKTYKLQFADPNLHALARRLLPAEVRERF
ncbi:MAG TPA: hypothetical protein VFT72_07755 [Opitutaceae bacterium]|nr:hypothetical protein [Opitutaceae bacterium]